MTEGARSKCKLYINIALSDLRYKNLDKQEQGITKVITVELEIKTLIFIMGLKPCENRFE